VTTTTMTSTVTSAGYPPLGQQISSPPGLVQTKGVSGDTWGNYNVGGQTPNRDKGGIPNEVDSNNNANVQSNITGVGGGGDQGTAFKGGSPKTN
jgi:hypothetical protein